MKKSLKYLGATAAALLAVAPVAAPAVASVASFGVAHAADATPSFGDAVDAAVTKQTKNGVSSDDFADFVSAAFNYAQSSTQSNSSFDAAKDSNHFSAIVGTDAFAASTGLFATYQIDHVKATVTGTGLTAGMSGFTASNAVKANAAKADTTYSVTLSFYAAKATAATYTKTYSIVVPGPATPAAANKSAVKTTPYSFKSGETLPAQTDFVASVASHISGLTKADGSAVTVSNANIAGVGYGNGLTKATPTEFGQAIPDAGLSFDTVYVQLSGVTVADFGYSVGGSSATLAAITSDQASADGSGNPTQGKNAIANLYSDGTSVYVAVPVNVVTTTPNTDPTTTTTYAVGYTPTGSATGAKPSAFYTDGQTVALLNNDYTTPAATSFGEFINNLKQFAETLALNSKKDTDKTYTPVDGSANNASDSENVVAIEKLAAAAGVSYDETKGTFTSAGTLIVPVTVTSADKANSVTVNVPVKVAPTTPEVEKTISLTGNTPATLTVGDKFDPMAGITATAANGSAIAASYIKVDSNVDTTKAGTYTVTYTVTDPADSSETKSFSRVVTVVAPADVKAYTGTVYATQDNATLYTLKNGVLTANASTLSGKKDSAWKAFATLEQNGVTYYKLGSDSQWAKAVTTDKPAPVSNPVVVSDFAGVVYANVSGGSPVYTLNEKTGAVAATGRALAQGSAWKGFKKAVVDGVTYVNLGGNQWIKDFGASYTTKVSGVATLKHSAALYSNDAVLTARTLAKGSRYKVSAKVQLNGVTYYQIGGLVKASDVSFR